MYLNIDMYHGGAFKFHRKGHKPWADEQFISSSSLYHSSFYPCASSFSTTTTTNVKIMFSSTLVSKPKFWFLFFSFLLYRTCPITMVETSRVKHFKVPHIVHKPSPTLDYQWNNFGMFLRFHPWENVHIF